MRILALVVALAVSNAVLAQGKGIEGLPVGLGDSIEKVQAAFGTTLEPEPSKSTMQNTRQLRLRTRGVSVFFDQDGKAYTIRLEAPFAGNVGGVKIGDTRAVLVEKLGKPAKVMKAASGYGPPNQRDSAPYIYYIDDRTTVRFDFDRDNEIEAAYLIK